MTDIEKYGFSLIRTRDLSELDATLYELEHIKSGARVIYFDREDDNKTFAIGFATPPEDDTGVFHIIEHSVLCGSKKYPLNDPFTELLKGSLNTFLNAITYEDRTIYPVSSRCEKDFLNLVDVYMDAVFAPNMLKNPLIFKQEGWRYEYDEQKDSLSYNGVVYNEMRGAYSSPDELGTVALNRALFVGTPYCYDAGGCPSSITDLTYEQFKATHKKYYHPSNAKIMLDGRIDLEKILPMLNSHLAHFEKRDAVSLAGTSEVKISPTVTVPYEIPEGEEEHSKARVLYGYVYSSHSDSEAHLTTSILSDILCGSNASPLKKALLDRGLAKDVTMYGSKSRELTMVIEVRDADEERLDEIDSVINEVISSLINNGIDKKNIISALNSIEFRLRERDYGTLPIGIVYAMTLFGSWMYGENPEDTLLLDEVISSVRGRVDSDHFERSLCAMTLENPHRAKVVMIPDKTFAERSAREESEKLKKILADMSVEEKRNIVDEEQSLRLWQMSEPTEEAISSLPALTLADIPERSGRPSAILDEVNGVKIIKCPTKTNGIVYISILFDASDLKDKEFIYLSMLSAALTNFPTGTQDTLSLQNDIKENLGGLFASFAISNKDGVATPYLKIGAKALESKSEDMLRLIEDLLLGTKIEDESEISKIIAQIQSHMEDAMISSGESVALARVEAGRSEAGAIAEYLSGYEAYRILNEKYKDANAISELTASVRELLKKLIDRSRLTLSVAGNVDNAFIDRLVSIFPDSGHKPIKKTTPPCAGKSEFFLIPSKVAYAVIGGSSDKIAKNLGFMRVARSILSYEYLWNTVRVQSGAYGTGVVPRKDGSFSFYSYRDPSPARSLTFYKESADYLRAIANDKDDITKFIIGAIGEYDTLITPRTASTIVTSDYLNGWTADDEARVRSEMLNMTADDLLTVADIIDEILSDQSLVIVGGTEHLNSLEKKPEQIIKI